MLYALLISRLCQRLTRASLCAAALALLACGGGGSGSDLLSFAPGVGTGGTGSVAGTLTGLGSVIVDGVRYDDSQAVLERQSDLLQSETLSLSDLQVGQYVYMQLDATGTPSRVRLESQLVGPVGSVNVAEGRLTVWSQTVEVNTDPNRGPVTVFSGYADINDVNTLDPVQLYGVLQNDPTNASRDIFRATRLERLASTSSLPARLSGTLRTGSAGVLLAGLPLDTTQALTAGTAVTIVIPWTQDAKSPSATWKVLSLRTLGSSDSPANASTVRLSGAVLLRPDGLIMVQGVLVDVSATTLASTRAALTHGSYITVTGVPDRSTGTLVASAIDTTPAGGRPLELRGSVTSLVDAQNFVVRGLQINASAAQWLGGTASELRNGRYVELTGSLVGNVFQAGKVVLQSGLPDKAVLDLTGVVQTTDASQPTVRILTQDAQTISVALPGTQALPGIGDTVRVEGFWKDGLLHARVLTQQPAPDPSITRLRGMVEAVGVGQFRLNGVLIQVDLTRFPTLRLTRGERIEIGISKASDGRYSLVEFKTQPPLR